MAHAPVFNGWRHVGDRGISRHEADIAEAAKLTDAVEKRFLAPERRKAFQKIAHVENIDSSVLDFGSYYCLFMGVERSLADFFDNIDPLRHFF